MNSKRFVITVTLGLLGLVVALVWLSAGSPGGARAADASANLAGITICPAGSPDCDDEVRQAAVDAAGHAGDLLRVATGHNPDVSNHAGLAQGVDYTQWTTITMAYLPIVLKPAEPSDWSPMPSGTTLSLYGVWGSSGSDVFAVGNYGIILHYDGTAWTAMSSGTTEDLYSVWGSGGSDVFAVGYPRLGDPWEPSIILHYDGTAWSEMDSGLYGRWLWDVWGSSGSDVFAVGSGGAILHYDGAGWSPMSNPGGDLFGVWGSSGSDVFAVGGYGTIVHYDGAGWSAMSNPGGYFNDVWGSDGSDVFAVGGEWGPSAPIVHYDGTGWSAVSSGTAGDLWCVWGSSGSDVFAVGGSFEEPGVILHYDGTAWSSVDSGTTEWLRGVWGSSGSDVFAVGWGGTILHYSGGAQFASPSH